MSSYCCFPGFLILPVRTWLSAFFTLKLIVKTIKRKLILHMNLLKVFIFQHGLKLKLIFLKSNAQVMKLICYRKYNHEVEKHCKVLSALIDTIIRLGRLGLSFHGYVDDSKYYSNVGKYSIGGVGKVVESVQFRVSGGDKVLGQHLKNCSKNASYISKTLQNDLISYYGQSIT